MSTALVNGARLVYRERGKGEPLVLVHGSASDLRTWEEQLPALGERYRAISYSRRYHWPNDPIPEGRDYAMPEHVDDLRALLEALGAAPAHIVGHSYGAFLALLLAIGEPRLVRSLVLCEPPAITLYVSNDPRPAEIIGLTLRKPRTAAALVRFGAAGAAPAKAAARRGDMAAATEALGRAVLGAEFYERLSAERLEQARANTMRAELLGSGFAPLDDASVRALRMPVLLVGGGRSPEVFPRLLDRLQELLPHAERVEIAEASHIVHEDSPGAYNAAVATFLSR